MSTLFSQLRKRWDLKEDISNKELLFYVKIKLKEDPDNPELIYVLAELQRHLGETKEAIKSYKETIQLTDQRTQQRGISLEQQLVLRRKKVFETFLLYTLFPFLVILLSAIIYWNMSNKPEELNGSNKEPQFAFTNWLAKRQLVEIMSTLKKQNPEISFESNGSVTQSTEDFLLSLMKPNSLSQLKREQQESLDKGKNKGKEAQARFQCAHEAPVQCTKQEMSLASGKPRKGVAVLMQSYWAILKTEKDCKKLESSIETIIKQLNFRESEKEIKVILDSLSIECFSQAKDIENTLKQARKLQCTDSSYINTIYWYKTISYHRAGKIKEAQAAYRCYQDALKHAEKIGDITLSEVASRHRESAVLAWLYFGDLPTAMNELITARKTLKGRKNKTASMLRVISEINLDLMEAYVTDNVDIETFKALLEEINSSGLLTDPYKQIKDTLTAIYYLQNKDNATAIISLQNLRSRYKLIPEFICGWDWSGFIHSLETSTYDKEMKEKIIKLVAVSSCEEPQPMEQRIKSIDQILQWIQAH
ncbi:MAG: hypothetical protein KAH22_05570 [Thiotrichaceae bacterium]|nr:hypothetical protein [Thiotrichaceae bacterium]